MSDNRLLIIDDEIDVAQIVAKIAVSAGYEARTTCDVGEFRQIAKSGWPSHVVLDLQMPQADGVEVLRFLGEIQSSARILLCSGVDPGVLEHARRLGVERGLDLVGTLSKPFRAAELKRVLTAARVEPQLTREKLAAAIAAREVRPAYQPLVDASSWALCGVEALARWYRPDGSVVPPLEFIPFAEEQGLIEELTASLTSQILDQLVVWDRSGCEIAASINLSASRLTDLDFVDWFVGDCRRAGVDPGRITFELTESVAMSRVADAMDILTRLRLRNVSLSIDDFGTGYSSLVQLRRLPFTELKIDRSFVADFSSSSDARAITTAIIAMARALGLGIVAEGVEDEETAMTLGEAGCDVLQGYFFAKPLNPSDIPGWSTDPSRAGRLTRDLETINGKSSNNR